MVEKDYIMRLFTNLINALNRIINCIESDDIQNAKIQLDDAYQLLGNDSSYYRKTAIDKIIFYFKTMGEDYLEKIKFLSELMYYDFLTHEGGEEQKSILKKSILLLEHHNQNTNVYSLELNNKLRFMKNKFQNL